MLENKNKENLIRWFTQMQEMEKSAKDFYLEVVSNPRVDDEEIKQAFQEIANDEQRHVEIIQKIINIIKNNL